MFKIRSIRTCSLAAALAMALPMAHAATVPPAINTRLNLRTLQAQQTYDRFIARHGVVPTRAAMFEDLARNLSVPHSRGMTTVLVVPEGTREVFREGWELEGRDAPHVDHVTDDLAAFLRHIAQP